MELSRQEYWSGLPFLSPEDRFPNPGIEPRSPVLQADSLLSEPPGIFNRLQYPVNLSFFFFFLPLQKSLLFLFGPPRGQGLQND